MKQIKLWCWAAPSALMLSVSVQASSVGLAELLDAVEGNPQVQEGQAELRSAEAGLNLANLQSAPRIRLSLDNDLAHSDDATRRAEVKVEKSLFDWGKAQASVEVAQARKASKELNVLARADELRRNVINQFAQGATELEKIAVFEQSLDELSELEANMSRRVEQRISPETELRVVQGKIRQQQVLIRESRGRIRNAELALLQATGVSPSAWALPLCSVEKGERQLVTATLDVSSELKAQQAEIKELQASLIRLTKSHLPELIGGVGLIGDLEQMDSDTRAYLSVQYEADLVGRNQAEYAENQAKLDAALAAEQTIINQLLRDVGDLLNQYRTSRDLQPTYELLIEAQERQVSSQNRRFKSGLSSWLDVLNAQEELTRTRTALVQARATQCQSALLLDEITKAGHLDG